MTDTNESSPEKIFQQKETNQTHENINIETQKTDRIRAYSELIKSISKFIWIAVVLIIIIHFWGSFSTNHIKQNINPTTVNISIPEQQQYQISTEVTSALGKALVASRQSASNNLEQWKNEVMHRVDHPFLDWYYNYFNQLGIGAKSIWINLYSISEEEKAEKLIGSFQQEFAKQVFQPSLMQLEMERFTRQAVDIYVSEANRNLAGVQSAYNIPQPTWERFLEGLGSITYNAGGQQQDLTLRAVSRGTGYLATTAMIKAIGFIGTKKVVASTVSKATSKAVTKLATKTAAKAAAEGGGEMAVGLLGLELLNPIAGLGIIVWDVWDHYHTVQLERPILRASLESYLNEVKESLLNDPENGILSSVNKFHDGILNSLNSNLGVS
jgi:large-conductance mechanosensitive channel